MSAAAMLALTVLVIVMRATKNPPENARTLAQLWDSVRALGWHAPLRGVVGLAALLGLIAACLSVVLFGAAIKVGEGALIVGQATVWHVSDLIGWAPVQVKEWA